ncbi:MAG TPA: hypothetical protein VMB79_01065 [Jatrophihabitans sp.]|nr:hypothetical protein [Jatrophihabitans sp.]
MRLELHALGGADADLVWQRYQCPARWHEWAPQIRGVHLSTPDGSRPALPTDLLRPGVTGTVRGPLGVPAGFLVQQVDEQPDATSTRRWSWQVRFGPVRLTLQHSVRPTSRGGTRTGLAIQGPAPVVLGYVPVAQLALARLVRPEA